MTPQATEQYVQVLRVSVRFASFHGPDGVRVCGFEIAEAERAECSTGDTNACALHKLTPRKLHVHVIGPP